MADEKELALVNEVLKNVGCRYAFINECAENSRTAYRDIDILLHSKDIPKVVTALIKNINLEGYKLYNRINNSYSTQLFFVNDSNKEKLQLDLMPEISFRGLRYFGFEEIDLYGIEVVKGRPRLSDNYKLAYHIIRDLLQKGKVNKEKIRQYTELGAGDFKILDVKLRRLFGKKYTNYILSGKCEIVKLRKIRNIFFFRTFVSSPLSSIKSIVNHIYFTLNRFLKYPGVMIVFLGPDGSGKSSVLSGIKSSNPEYLTSQYYLLPGWFRRYRAGASGEGVVNVSPHAQNRRSKLFSIVKLFIWLVEYTAGYYQIILKKLFRGNLVLFDRYISDMVVDTKRYRYNGPVWFINGISKLVPSPDITILLYASPEVIHTRKQEVPFEETIRQLREYKKYVDSIDGGVVIDANQELPKVISNVNRVIDDYMVSRSSRRFKQHQDSYD